MHNSRKYFKDILVCIDEIYLFIDGIDTFKKFQNNIIARKATERNLEIIGECCKRLAKSNIILEKCF